MELSRPLNESRIHFKKSVDGGSGSVSAFGGAFATSEVLAILAVLTTEVGRAAETAGAEV